VVKLAKDFIQRVARVMLEVDVLPCEKWILRWKQ
jgi:hypothetical protein